MMFIVFHRSMIFIENLSNEKVEVKFVLINYYIIYCYKCYEWEEWNPIRIKRISYAILMFTVNKILNIWILNIARMDQINK